MTSYANDAAATAAPAWTLPLALSRLQPEACGLLAAVNERIRDECDPALAELLRLRAAQLIGNPAAEAVRYGRAAPQAASEAKIRALPQYPVSPLFSAAEREAIAFAEQFIMDVGGTTADTRAGLIRRFGAGGARLLASAIYVLEFTQRLQLVAARLLADDPAGPEPPGLPASGGGTVAELLTAYQEAVIRGSALDPVTTELVRLRCARAHQCRICQTLRLADARAAGVDAAMTDQIDFYERSTLPERAKVALRVTDAFITRPDTLSATTAEQARTMFAPPELASLCLDITKWSTQKIHVALGTDGADGLATDGDGVAVFGFDEAGRPTGYRH
jgi:AhpD family alkylhydroperoxidase